MEDAMYDATTWITEGPRETQTASVVIPGVIVASDWAWRFMWTWRLVVQLMVSCVGIAGNLLVILALAKWKATKHSTDIFIGGLALADLITSILLIPIPTATRVPASFLGTFFCKVIYTKYVLWTSITASAYILAGMSVERFVAVVFPLRFQRVITRRRIYGYVTAVWVCSAGLCLFAITLEVSDNVCIDTKTRQVQQVIPYFFLVLRICIPVATMGITQLSMALSLHRQSRNMLDARTTSKGSTPTFHIRARNRVVKMTSIIVIVFILSLSPRQLVALYFASKGTLLSYLRSPFSDSLALLSFVNACANPVIYAARYPKFRSAIKDIFRCGVAGEGGHLFSQNTDFTDDSVNKSKQPSSSNALDSV